MFAFMVNGPSVDLSDFLELYRERLTCHQTFAKSRKHAALPGIFGGMRRDVSLIVLARAPNQDTAMLFPRAGVADQVHGQKLATLENHRLYRAY
jgi:hypothetical protein